MAILKEIKGMESELEGKLTPEDEKIYRDEFRGRMNNISEFTLNESK